MRPVKRICDPTARPPSASVSIAIDVPASCHERRDMCAESRSGWSMCSKTVEGCAATSHSASPCNCIAADASAATLVVPFCLLIPDSTLAIRFGTVKHQRQGLGDCEAQNEPSEIGANHEIDHGHPPQAG